MLTTVRRRDVHDIAWVVRDRGGHPVDLTDATAELHLQQGHSTPVVAPVEIDLAVPGRVVYHYDGTLAAGPWIYEIQLDKAGTTITAPTSGSMELLVEADIA
jgi:nitrogen fixation protein FixH